MRFLYCICMLGSIFICCNKLQAENPMVEAMEAASTKTTDDKTKKVSATDIKPTTEDLTSEKTKTENTSEKSTSTTSANPMLAAMEKAATKSTVTTADSAKKTESDMSTDSEKEKASLKPAPKLAVEKKSDDTSSDVAKKRSDDKKSNDDIDKASKSSADDTKDVDPKASDSAKPILEVVSVESHVADLDTTQGEAGGNWLEKRIWLKKSEHLFDEIRVELKKTTDLRMDFVHLVHAAGQKIDEFYEKISFDKGQIDELLKNVNDEISQATAKRGGDLSDKERSIKVLIHTEQKEIEELGKDIQKIGDFDTQIDKAMTQSFKIIDISRGLETKAWNAYKSIGSEIDDKKARASYYEVDNVYQNIKQNVQYLQATLLPYLKTKLIAPLEQVIGKIKTATDALKEKGINLDTVLKKDEADDIALEKKREKETEKGVEKKQEEAWREQDKKKEQAVEQREKARAEKIIEEEKQTWYYRLFSQITDTTKCITCWVIDKARCVTCLFFNYTKEVSHKSIEQASAEDKNASFWDLSKELWGKIVEMICLIGCYIKTFICSIKNWICSLFISE